MDPIEGGCANDYVYVNGDPLNRSDLTGTWWIFDDIYRGARTAWNWISSHSCAVGLGVAIAAVAVATHGAGAIAVGSAGGVAALGEYGRALITAAGAMGIAGDLIGAVTACVRFGSECLDALTSAGIGFVVETRVGRVAGIAQNVASSIVSCLRN